MTILSYYSNFYAKLAKSRAFWSMVIIGHPISSKCIVFCDVIFIFTQNKMSPLQNNAELIHLFATVSHQEPKKEKHTENLQITLLR
jgi:hypothetical protein